MKTKLVNDTRSKIIGKILPVFILLTFVFSAAGLGMAQRAQAAGEPMTPSGASSLASHIQQVATPTPVPTEPAPVLPLGQNCSSPIEFDNQWSNGYRLVCQNNLYVLMVDLTNPAIKVEVVAASSGTHPLSYYADGNTLAIINADYQWPCPAGAICSQGMTISNGSNPTQYTNVEHLCTDAWVRREIGISQDGYPVIDWWYKFVSDSQARSWCSPWHSEGIPNGDSGGGKEQYSYNLVGAGPQFTFDGSFRWICGDGTQNHDCPGTDVIINGEHFKPGSWWNRYQSAIGYSTDGTTLVLAESNNQTHTMQDVHDIMYQRLSAYGKTLKNAFKFDGGSKAGFWYYNHTYDSTPGVTVPNVIRIQRTNSTCYSLSTNVNPGGAGNISINTAPNCAQGKYLPGTNVQLTANANSGYTFGNWSGDASGSSNPTTLTMNSNKNVTANFSAIQTCYSLNTNVNPGGAGSVSLNPAPNCSGTQYTSGTNVQLTAHANTGYSFSNWGGDTSGSSNPTGVVMNGNKNITANFSPSPSCPTITAWKGEYWNNRTLTGNSVLCRNDAKVNFVWGAGGPGGNVPNDGFSARWTRSLAFNAGTYRFHVRADDGVRLWIDNVLVIDQWKDQAPTEYAVNRTLRTGAHSLKIEYYENSGGASAQFWWGAAPTSGADDAQVVGQSPPEPSNP